MADSGSKTNGGGTTSTGGAPPGGPTVNGCLDDSLTPELLYKMNKKIAQLTKVVYGLNTRGEELEAQLAQAQQVEAVLREANTDLQRRASLYKNKLDVDGPGGTDAHYYRMECEGLKERLEEMSLGASREAAEQRRRERALQGELEQARQAVTAMQAHHDFLSREHDAKHARDEEMNRMEWHAGMQEQENRHATQLSQLTDECDALRRRLRSASEEAAGREQMTALAMERELQLQQKEHEIEEERIKNLQEKREREQRMRQLTEERRREEERWQERFRSTTRTLEELLKDEQERREQLTKTLSDQETAFEARLKAKAAEWKSQWDTVETGLQGEILRLKGENAVLQSSRAAVNAEASVQRLQQQLQQLQEQLQQKAVDYDLLVKNLKMRIGVSESEAKALSSDAKSLHKQLKEEKEKSKQVLHRDNLRIEALERHLREESERHKITQNQYDNLKSRVKRDLEDQVKHLKETESILMEEHAKLLVEFGSAKDEIESLTKKMRDNDKEHKQMMETEVKAAEGRVKARVEKSWVEKLKRTEESAAHDLERQRETHRRSEVDLRKELMTATKAEEEAKRLNEEFKKKVRQLRQSESELTQRLAQAESADARERSVSRSRSSVSVSDDVSVHTHRKELASVEAKYQVQVDQLTLALTQKQGELTKCKAEAERIQKQSEERRKKEQEEFKERLIKEKTQLEEKHNKDIEERNRKELEERDKRKKEEADKAVQTSELPCNDEEGKRGRDEEEESEAESNKRKLEALSTEVLVLRQQNEQFEELVRQKHRSQMELELQMAESAKEVSNKDGMVESIKVELTHAKHETELSKAGVRRMEEEVAEYKEKIEALEQEVDASERELKRMEILQEKLRVTETKRNELQVQIDEIETERDEEIKIIQDALDEAAQEREELLLTFEKEIEKLNSVNAGREAQMLEDFENKLRELEQQHKRRIGEKEAEVEGALHRSKRQHDNEETRQKLDKMKSELNSEWEDKLRSECSRLKGELDALHAEEKHLAVETIKVQKDQELQTIKKNFEVKAEDMAKEISSLKDALSSKDAFYHEELDDLRTRADRDVWELRRKLQKLDEASYDRQQHLEDKHREDMERLREEYVDRTAGLEAQLASVDVRGMSDMRAQLEQRHKEQMEHLGEQHRLSMERLRDELEAEKFQAAEEARVIVTKHHEYINSTLRDQLTEAITANTQYRDEIEAIRFALSRREEVIRSLEEDVAKLRSSKGGSSPPGYGGTSPPGYGGSSQSQFLHEGSQGSRNSQDRLSNEGLDDEGHRGSGLLGKVFGGGWFSGAKTKEGGVGPGSGGAAGTTASSRRGSSGLYRQAW